MRGQRTYAHGGCRRSAWWLRRRALSNLLRMGHCAPSVTRTVLEASGAETAKLVKLAAGLPGGVGNTGEECGGITGPLLCLGLLHARDPLVDGLPPILYMGHDLMRQFATCHGTLRCNEIRRPTGVPLRCIGVVVRSPVRWQATTRDDWADAITGERRDAFRLLHAHLTDVQLHCARTVLEDLRDCVPVDHEILDASAGFVGGTVFCGLTCSALSAGIMAMGAARGEIENSLLRVARMIALMAVGGDAFADRVNAFNRLMNGGNRLASWFTERFGSTSCATLTGCDFATLAGVRRYIGEAMVGRCRGMAASVAAEVRRVLREDQPAGAAASEGHAP